MKITIFSYESASLILTESGKKYTSVITDFRAIIPKKGHGTKALKKAVKYCDRKNIKVILEVESGNPDVSNTKLRKYYQRFGFVALGPRPYKMPIIMQRNPRK